MTAQLTFSDEFDGLSLWNGASGRWNTTFWYDEANKGSTLPNNGEQQMYINANFGPTAGVRPWNVSNGVLTLTAAPASSEVSAALGGYQYTSGQINTFHSFSQLYGYFEMKAQLPTGQGLWPAFWLMPTSGAWPPELDVMEQLGSDPSKFYTTVHTDQGGQHAMFTQGHDVGDTAGGFHTYGVDWKPDKITFYFDNRQVYQVDTPADMHSPMYMMANLAVGGYWPGSPNGSTPFPANMNIDYIRAYTGNPYAEGGASQAASAPAIAGSTPAVANSPLAAGQPFQDGSDSGDNIVASDGQANNVRGLGGDDRLTGGAQANVLNGNWGNDTVIGRSDVGDELYGGQGDDWVDATQSHAHNLLNGNRGNDNVRGGDFGDTLYGGQGDDLIVGGAGADWISGDLGNDTVAGGRGGDIFFQRTGGGSTTVTDFNRDEGDRVQLNYGAAYHTWQQGEGNDASVVIGLDGGGQIVLQHTQISALTEGWIFT